MGLVDNASRAMQMLRWGYALSLVMGVMLSPWVADVYPVMFLQVRLAVEALQVSQLSYSYFGELPALAIGKPNSYLEI
jgi:hypothetical protein